jgi:hypothetical protein
MLDHMFSFAIIMHSKPLAVLSDGMYAQRREKTKKVSYIYVRPNTPCSNTLGG